MAPPGKVRWTRKRHTQAKHQVLVDYLAAWIPILASQGGDLIFIDGFAGPGTYEDGAKGSPLLMLDAYARRADRGRLGVTAHFFFIEQHTGRKEALLAEVEKRKEVADIEIEVIHGDYDAQFPALLDRLHHRWPRDLPRPSPSLTPSAGERGVLRPAPLVELLAGESGARARQLDLLGKARRRTRSLRRGSRA